MKRYLFVLPVFCGIAAFLVVGTASGQAAMQKVPTIGDKSEDFKLTAVAGELSGDVKLSSVNEDGPVVIVVLRGYPGYQCPICSRQVGSFIAKADQFLAKKAKVLFIYPGPSSDLKTRAKEFLRDAELPSPFTLLLDPDYTFTNAYGLRWKAPRETAYPSTFVIDAAGKVAFARVSKTHGDRTDADTILRQL